MNGRKHFQPSGKCGNCQFFRHTDRDKAKQIIKEAHCSKDLDPKECGEDEFKSRSKRTKKIKRKRRWHQEAR